MIRLAHFSDLHYGTKNLIEADRCFGNAVDRAIALGVEGYLIDGPEEIKMNWLAGKQRIGVTAGASAPEILVQRVLDRIRTLASAEITQLKGVEEGVSFPLPRELV